MPTGQVKFFDSRRGFGFIKPDDGTRDVFVSVNAVPKDAKLTPEVRLSYEIEAGKKGPYAKDLVVL